MKTHDYQIVVRNSADYRELLEQGYRVVVERGAVVTMARAL